MKENVLAVTKPVSVDVLKIKRENVDSVMIELQTEAEKMLKEEL